MCVCVFVFVRVFHVNIDDHRDSRVWKSFFITRGSPSQQQPEHQQISK